MNKFSSSSLIVLTAASITFPVYAQSQPTRRPSISFENSRRSDAAKSANFKDLVMKILGKYEDRLMRYEEFLRKVQSRSEKLPRYKKQEFLGKARENLDDAKRILALVRVRLNALDYTQPRRVLMPMVLVEMKSLKDAMVTLHTSMAASVKSLKESTL